MAYNKNEVTRLKGLDYINGQNDAIFENSDYVSRVEVGHPVGYFYGMSYSGVWQNQSQIDAARAAGKAVDADAQPGDLIWDDYDGDGVISYDGDRHDIGNPHPDVTMGLSPASTGKGSTSASQAPDSSVCRSCRAIALHSSLTNTLTTPRTSSSVGTVRALPTSILL